MSPDAAEVDLVVDAGGSGTRLGLARDGELLATVSGPTCNPHSGGREAADRLTAMIESIWSQRPSGVSGIDIALLGLSEAATPARLRSARDRLADPLDALSPRTVWIVNDIVPLVVSAGAGVVVICGTGTGFAAIGPTGTWARASGLEWLLTDEGGGSDIGRRGLQAVVRAADGRGAPTALTASAETCFGVASADALFERLNGADHAKTFLASFAPSVMDAAARGDGISIAIVDDCADELARGVAAVASRAGLGAGGPLHFGGSLLVGADTELRRRFLARLDGRFDPRALPADPLVSAAHAAVRLRGAPDSLRQVPLALRLQGQPAVNRSANAAPFE